MHDWFVEQTLNDVTLRNDAIISLATSYTRRSNTCEIITLLSCDNARSLRKLKEGMELMEEPPKRRRRRLAAVQEGTSRLSVLPGGKGAAPDEPR